MDRNEYIKNPSDFSFSVNPLDVNLTKMQYNLIERMKAEGPIDGVPFSPIAETYTSENPLREYGEICIIIYKDENSLTGLYYIADIYVWNKEGNFSTTWHL